ncbi:MAG: FHA domain-containing protein [Planctomycetes bacterium]|nr:FHA domain-containing protein [Planctomycetota bacterium]
MKTATAPCLEILTGDLSGRRYRVEDAEFVIGRAPTCDLVLPKRYISREHARISRAGRDYVIEGLSEKNPVTLRGRPVRPGHRLEDGQEFEVCGIRFRFLAQAEVAGGRRPAKETDDSWASDPDFGRPEQRPGQRSDPGEASGDSGERPRGRDLRDESAAPPRGLPVEDDDATPPPRRHARGPSEDDLPVPVRGSGAVKRSAPGKVVFDAEPEGDDDSEERTAELPAVGSRAGGGSRESQNERTAELGKVKDPNDPDYDPFAEVDRRKKEEKKGDPGREKALRALMVLGAGGILLAAVIIYKTQQKKPYVLERHTGVIRVAIDQTVRFEEPWSQVDPPQGRRTTPLDGEPYFFHRDRVADVEWAVPHVKTKCIFLIRGIEPGAMEFDLVFPESRRVKRFTVEVEGDNPHDVARERRRAEMKGKVSAHQLRQKAEAHMASGETYVKERDITAREGNYRLAVIEFTRAVDSAVLLRDQLAQGGIVPGDVAELVRRAEDAEAKARNDYDEFVHRELAKYRATLQKNTTFERVEQLKRTLRAINHECDLRFIRLKLILQNSFNGTWTGGGGEVCTER